MLVDRRDNAPPMHRFRTMGPDASYRADNGDSMADGIQDLLPDGFQVGTRARVNKAGSDHFWVAFRDVASVDLSVSKTVDDAAPTSGDNVTYTVTVSNLGENDATNVSLSD